MLGSLCFLLPKLIYRPLVPTIIRTHPSNQFRFNIMSKRSLSEKVTVPPAKKSKNVCDKKLGYGVVKSVKKLEANSSVASPPSELEKPEPAGTTVDSSTCSGPSTGPHASRDTMSGSAERGANKRVSVATKPRASPSGRLFGKLRNKPPKRQDPKPLDSAQMADEAPRRGAGIKFFDCLERPVKSSRDVKEYKIIRLCNGLRAILVSDMRFRRQPGLCDDDSSDSDSDSTISRSTATSGGVSDSDLEEEKMELDFENDGHERVMKPHKQMEEKLAAVGLTVGVGSFSDPEDIPGLAHFLEHMVFMGSTRYPKENDFDSFIKRHGGSDNARTSFETTTFYFECQDKHLWKGMDKFAQFFTDPLLKKEAMKREREAIEAEFQECKTSDVDRIIQLMAGLAKRGHPASKFTWGNSVTLQENVDDDRLQAALHTFRERHYSSHRMTLAVEARLPMEELECLVADCFSSIPNNQLPADDFSSFTDTFDTDQFNRIYRVLSVKDRIEMLLTWAFPSFLPNYKNKPYEYFECLFDHEGPGSLLSYLRKKLWALEMASGQSESGYEDNSMFFLFTITVLLTDEGYRHLNEVIRAVFSYIAMLRCNGPSERFYEELRSMTEANFTYADEVPPSDNVEQLSEALQYFEPRDVLAARYLLYDFNPQAIRDFQDRMTPDRVNIVIASRDESVRYDQEEPWFQTKYSMSDIPREWRESWRTAQPDVAFHLPDPNIYIPTDLGLLPPDKDEVAEDFPFTIEATKLREVWYKRDTKFNLPIACYMLYLISPLPSTSPFNSALLDIYCSMLEYNLAADLYAARLGSIAYVITPADHGIKIRVGGFNEKLPLVMHTIARHMAAFKDNFNELMFNSLKDERAKMYYNRFIKPDKLNSELRLHLLLWRYWTTVNKHAAVCRATKQMLLDFVHDYHGSLYVQALVQGNVTRQQALQACHTISDLLGCRVIPDFQYPEFRVSRIDLGSRLLRVASFNQEDSNSVITNYYQCGPGTIKSCVILELVLSLMEEPLFDTLRTKEQLGYSVDCLMKDTYGVIGYTITVNYQEDKFRVDHVQERIESFLETFLKTFNTLKSKTFDEARKTLVKLKMCSDVHLREECNRHWGEIHSTAYLFDRPFKEVECLNLLTLKEVRAWVHEQLVSESNFRKLSIQVVGNPSPKKTEDTRKTSEEPRKTSKHKLSQLHTQHVHPDTKISELELLALPQLPEPKYALAVATPDGRSEEAIRDINEYRRKLSVYPLHRILN